MTEQQSLEWDANTVMEQIHMAESMEQAKYEAEEGYDYYDFDWEEFDYETVNIEEQEIPEQQLTLSGVF